MVLDEGWQALTRDANGRQQANATKFPAGISSLSSYIHNLGLKIGIYRYTPLSTDQEEIADTSTVMQESTIVVFSQEAMATKNLMHKHMLIGEWTI